MSDMLSISCKGLVLSSGICCSFCSPFLLKRPLTAGSSSRSLPELLLALLLEALNVGCDNSRLRGAGARIVVAEVVVNVVEDMVVVVEEEGATIVCSSSVTRAALAVWGSGSKISLAVGLAKK